MNNDELIALGLKVQEWRRKGGKSVMQKYGKNHFSLLGKLSAKKRAETKALSERDILPIDND